MLWSAIGKSTFAFEHCDFHRYDEIVIQSISTHINAVIAIEQIVPLKQHIGRYRKNDDEKCANCSKKKIVYKLCMSCCATQIHISSSWIKLKINLLMHNICTILRYPLIRLCHKVLYNFRLAKAHIRSLCSAWDLLNIFSPLYQPFFFHSFTPTHAQRIQWNNTTAYIPVQFNKLTSDCEYAFLTSCVQRCIRIVLVGWFGVFTYCQCNWWNGTVPSNEGERESENEQIWVKPFFHFPSFFAPFHGIILVKSVSILLRRSWLSFK